MFTAVLHAQKDLKLEPVEERLTRSAPTSDWA